MAHNLYVKYREDSSESRIGPSGACYYERETLAMFLELKDRISKADSGFAKDLKDEADKLLDWCHDRLDAIAEYDQRREHREAEREGRAA